VPYVPNWLRPNHLSLARLLLVLPVVLLFIKEYYLTGIIIFIFGFFLDALDGTLARTRNQITKLGRILDPVADKIFFLASLIILGSRFLDYYIFIFILIVELITLLQGIIALPFIPLLKKWGFRKEVGANIFGKYKMTWQVIGLLLIVAGIYLPNIIIASEISLIIGATLGIFSMLKHQIFQSPKES